MNKFGFFVAFLVFTLSMVTLVLLLLVEDPEPQEGEATTADGGTDVSASKLVRQFYKAKRLTTEGGRKAAVKRLTNPRSAAARLDRANRESEGNAEGAVDTPGVSAPGQPGSGADLSASDGSDTLAQANNADSGADAAGTAEAEAAEPVQFKSLVWTPSNDSPPYSVSLGTFSSKRAGAPTVERLELAEYQPRWARVTVDEYNGSREAWLLYTESCDDHDCIDRVQWELKQLGLYGRLIVEPSAEQAPAADTPAS